jgi:hypothetical protein
MSHTCRHIPESAQSKRGSCELLYELEFVVPVGVSRRRREALHITAVEAWLAEQQQARAPRI